jgi:hypothetical protein
MAGLLGCGRLGFDPQSDGGGSGSKISLELPAGGQFDHLAIGPDGTWYALSRTSGLFRLDGTTWSRCGARDYSWSVAVGPDNSVWLSGTDIARSTDRCATWTETAVGRFSDRVATVAGTVYALTDIGLRRWNGTGWTPVPTPLDGTRFLSIGNVGTTLLVGTQNGLLRSPDGTTWTAITAGLPSPVVAMISGGPTLAYSITTGAPGGVACGTNDGATWTTCDAAGGFSVLADPLNEQRVLAGVYDDLILTTNAFANVTRALRPSVGLDDALILDLAAAPDGTIFAATDRGVFVWPAGSMPAFEPRLTGLEAWDIDAMLRTGDDVYLATRGGVLHSAAGAPFTISTAGIMGNTNIRSLGMTNDGQLLAGGRHIFISSDRAATWSSARNLDATDAYVAPAIEIVDGVRAYVGTGTRILVADPPYTTWTERRFTSNRQVNAIRIVAGELWAGTSMGLFKSIDDGSTFTQVHTTETVRAITLLADGSLAVGTISNLYLSDPSRTTWSSVLTRNITSIIEVGTTIVATAENSAHYSKDRVTWQPLPGAETTSASALLYDGTLVIGANSGLVRVPLP